jgi:hypothetical protein
LHWWTRSRRIRTADALRLEVPFLENLSGEERVGELMVRVKHEWESFEV